MNEREPVRTNVRAAGVVVALSTFFGGLGIVDRITPQVMFAALGAALTQGGVIWFGAERARDKAWSPASVNELVDAEAAIAQLQGLHPPEA